MLAGRDKDGGAVLLGMEGGGAGDLADVADGVLVGSGVPVESLPFCGGEIGAGRGDEDGYVLGVEGMWVRAAVACARDGRSGFPRWGDRAEADFARKTWP